jgi:hypothetical protein
LKIDGFKMNESERRNQSERARPEICEEDVKGNWK